MRAVAKFIYTSCLCGKQTVDLLELMKIVKLTTVEYGEADASVMTCAECDMPMIMFADNKIYAYHSRMDRQY